MARSCEACNIEVEGKYSRFCNQCRPRQIKRRVLYKPNDQIDAEIKRLYLDRRDNLKLPPEIKIFAKQIGWPTWRLRHRAQELGICRTKEKPWSDEELQVLERFALMPPEQIRLRLKARGFQRTRTGITVKLKRMRFKSNTPYFTAGGLAQAFGVDAHLVLRWIKFGYLVAKHRGSERVPEQRGDIWMIHEKDVRNFIINHPMEFDLKRVDQIWFIDLIAGKTA